MNIDWKKGPGLKEISELHIQDPKTSFLSNGIKVLEVRGGTQPITKIDIVFKGGRFMEEKKLAARFVSSLLREGTHLRKSDDISEFLDYYGANFKSASNLDYNYISFSCLNKHFPDLIPLIGELVNEPDFDEVELAKYKKKTIDNLSLDLSKNEMICYREFTSHLYGDDHPYGYNTEKEDILALTKADIVHQFEKSFRSEHCYIVVTGKPEDSILNLLEKNFGNIRSGGRSVEWIVPATANGTKEHIVSKNEFQTAVKIGQRVCHRTHPDYPALFVLNTILGGYFSSRLMSVIREDLGLTYNIYSSIDNLRFDAYLYIGTEVSHDKANETVASIFKEVETIRNQPVGDQELMMVKNYLKGNFLSLVDGPFLQSSLVRSLELEGRAVSDFTAFFSSIQHVTKVDLMRAANTYFKTEDLTVVTVGLSPD